MFLSSPVFGLLASLAAKCINLFTSFLSAEQVVYSWILELIENYWISTLNLSFVEYYSTKTFLKRIKMPFALQLVPYYLLYECKLYFPTSRECRVILLSTNPKGCPLINVLRVNLCILKCSLCSLFSHLFSRVGPCSLFISWEHYWLYSTQPCF